MYTGKKTIVWQLLAVAILFSLIAVGCGGAAPAEEEAAPAEEEAAPAEEEAAPAEEEAAPAEEAAEPEVGPAPSTIKIGAALPLSGWAVSSAALPQTWGYEMWVEELNAEGGIYVKDFDQRIPIEYIVYDDESDPAKSAQLYEKLILEDEVDVLLAPWGTAWTFAAAPIANQYGYPLIGPTEASVELREAQFPYYFGLWNPAKETNEALLELVKDAGVESAAVIFVGTTYGIDQSAVSLPLLARAGVDVRLVQSYPVGVTDLSPVLKEIQAMEPDALIAYSYPEDALLIQEQLMVIDFNPPFFYNSLSGYPAQRDKLGAEAAEGMMSEGAWHRDVGTPGSAEFYDAFMEFSGEEPAWDSAYGWAQLEIWEQVLAEVGLDREQQRDYIASSTFETVWGTIKFTDGYNLYTGEEGGATPAIIGQWQGGQFEPIYLPDATGVKPIIYPKPEWPES